MYDRFQKIMVNFKKPNEESCLAIKFASKRLKSESKQASEPAQVEQAKRAEFLSQVKQIKQASWHKWLTATFSVLASM